MKKEIDLVEIVKSSEKSTQGYDNTDPKGRELASISSGGKQKKGGSQETPVRREGSEKTLQETIGDEETTRLLSEGKKEKSVEVETSPASSNLRWYMLALTCIMRASVYFTGDQINVLQSDLISLMGITTTKFSALNSLTGLIAIFMSPICGILMDKFGVELGLQIGIWTILVAQVCQARSVVY